MEAQKQDPKPLKPEVGSTTTNHRVIKLRYAVIGGVLIFFLSLMLLGGGLSAAYLIGKQRASGSIEQQRQTLVQEGDVIADVAQKVSPSVVSIVTEQTVTRSAFYGQQTASAAGTGVIVDAQGLVLTNKHVVPEGTTSVQVVMSDGKKYTDVTLVGRDPLNDLALLRINNVKGLEAVTLADSDKTRVGQKVIAIGNALGQFQNTVTSGIVSGIGRPVEAGDSTGQQTEQLTNLLQTDAAINSGNSGGPLLDFNGQVIGINTAVASDAQNIGFAIPINEARGIIASVQTTGKLSRPYIGVRYITLSVDTAKQLNVSVQQGAYVSTDAGSVVAGSPADKAGIKPGDVITKVENIEVNERNVLTSIVGRYKVGDTVSVTLIRDGKERVIKLGLAEAPTN